MSTYRPGVGFFTLLRREIHRFTRLANQTLIPPLITAGLYITIFGYSLGNRISSIEGVSYMHFLIPGLVMMSIINAAYSNTSSSLFSQRFQGYIQELLVSSMSTFEIVLAQVLGGVIRGVLVGSLVAVASVILAGVPILHIGITLFFGVFVAVIFSCAGFISALWAVDFDRLSMFQTYLLTPLTYLGGVFFSVEMLPPIWQKVALANPILYFVNGLRYGFLGFSDVGIRFAFISVVAVAGILFAITYRLFHIGYNIKS